MEKEDVNELIINEVDEITDDNIRGFIDDILRYERSQLEKESPRYKSEYIDALKKHVAGWSTEETS
ncbi:hypothetical protein [Salinigranum halophilum]|uniref:hypothetical protein n=1 Tax=Salinigranum halophilum TaxID=2565931 RepID=UPI0010A90979|nr:hypothetical protein [Salinigranum halophilum]